MKGQTNASNYTPLIAHVQSELLGNVIQCVGRLTYQRTAYKKGLLSGSIKITANSSMLFEITSLSKIGSLFGLTFVTPTVTQYIGQWITQSTRLDFTGYGSYVVITDTGEIQLGRLYNPNSYGSWTLSDVSDIFIMFQNVELTEA